MNLAYQKSDINGLYFVLIFIVDTLRTGAVLVVAPAIAPL